MMKKLISAVVAGIMLTFNCVGVYAVDDETSISINTAKYDNETKLVNVTGNVKNPVDSQIITIMSTGITQSSSFDFDTIVFIDQNEGVSFDENFRIKALKTIITRKSEPIHKNNLVTITKPIIYQW